MKNFLNSLVELWKQLGLNQRVSLVVAGIAVAAEEAGFDFLVISDHYHPWLTCQSHSAFAWSVLGAVAQATDRIELATRRRRALPARSAPRTR